MPQPASSSNPPATRPPSGLSQSTYASVASNAAKPAPLNEASSVKIPLKEPIPDIRLFFRLPDGHDAQKAQGFAIHTNLYSSSRLP